MTDRDFVVHCNPVWRGRADFVIRADIEVQDSPRRFEQLWAQQLEEERFEICCIPFFVYDLALGDEVETDSKYLIRTVLRASGRSTFRVWFGQSRHSEDREAVVDSLRGPGCELESYSNNLLGVAIDDERSQDVANVLHEREALGQLTYETGRTK